MRATLDPHAALCEAQRTRAARGLKIPAELWRTSACASWPGTTTRLEVSLVFCGRLAAPKPRDRRAETAIAVTIATSARWRRTSLSSSPEHAPARLRVTLSRASQRIAILVTNRLRQRMPPALLPTDIAIAARAHRITLSAVARILTDSCRSMPAFRAAICACAFSPRFADRT